MTSTLRAFSPSELALYHLNPRRGSVKDIKDSLRAHGQFKPVVVNVGTHTGRPHEVLAGNHTLMAFRDLQQEEPDDPRWRQVDGYLIDVDDDRAKRIVLVDNRTAELGTFDNEVLADLLGDLGDLTGTGYTEMDLSGLLGGEDVITDDAPAEEKYTNDSMLPQYEPSELAPELSELMDVRKTTELLNSIRAARLPAELNDFLTEAARRHTVINFRKVADYYAHADATTQRLFEEQALVILDMDDAVAKGYAVLRGELKTMFDTQYAAQKGIEL